MRLSQKCKATNWMRQSLPKNYQNPCTKNSEAWKFQEECMKWYMFDVEYAASNVPLHSSAHSQNLVAMLNFGRVIPQTVYALFYYVIINVGVIAYAVANDCCSIPKVCRSAYEMASESTNKTFKHTKRAWFFWYCFWLVVVVVGAVIIIITVVVTVVVDVVWSAKS